MDIQLSANWKSGLKILLNHYGYEYNPWPAYNQTIVQRSKFNRKWVQSSSGSATLGLVSHNQYMFILRSMAVPNMNQGHNISWTVVETSLWTGGRTDKIHRWTDSTDNDSHYNDVILSMIASQITSLTIVYSTIYSGADQRKHQSSASLPFVQEIHRGPVNSPHKGPVTWKMFPFDDVIMTFQCKGIEIYEMSWFFHYVNQNYFHVKILKLVVAHTIPFSFLSTLRIFRRLQWSYKLENYSRRPWLQVRLPGEIYNCNCRDRWIIQLETQFHCDWED